MLGTFALSSGYYDAYYGRAKAVLDRMRRELEAALTRVDVVATPTTPGPPSGSARRRTTRSPCTSRTSTPPRRA